jgi:ribosomal protein S13
VPDKVMPQLTYATKAEAPIFLEGVVVDASGKNSGKPAPNKNMLRVGLFAENKKGQSFTEIDTQLIEPPSLRNSTPYPGTKVGVVFLPSLGRFYCLGEIRMDAFSNDITLATSTADSPAEKSFITIDNDQNQIVSTNTDKTITIAKAQIILSTNKSSSISLNDKEGIEITSSDKIISKAKTDMENEAKTLTNKISGAVKNEIGGALKNDVSGNIENKAAKISNK